MDEVGIVWDLVEESDAGDSLDEGAGKGRDIAAAAVEEDRISVVVLWG